MSDDELQSFISQFLEQNQTWMEIGWDELKFFGDQLGAGAQGAVRKARWKGNDYAVKVFKTSETTDFEDEVRVLEHLRHQLLAIANAIGIDFGESVRFLSHQFRLLAHIADEQPDILVALLKILPMPD